jgi:hypothetical protein
MITFKVTPDGGDPYELVATSRDVYVWEKKGKDRTFFSLMKSMSMVSLYELCHVAAKRQQTFSGTLDEFVESHTLEIESSDDELDVNDLDPTQLAALLGR